MTGPSPSGVSSPCATTRLDVSNLQLASRIIIADANGVTVLNTNLRSDTFGQVRVQALDLISCTTSDVVRP